jgi:hypothetical protein
MVEFQENFPLTAKCIELGIEVKMLLHFPKAEHNTEF